MNARQVFDQQLEKLSDALIEMGTIATHQLDRAMQALQTGDNDLARQIMADDSQIDEMERSIEQRCLKLLLRQQPVAGDLRRVSTAIKMITDIERIADNAADIAEISLHLTAPVPEIQDKVMQMAHAARGMVAASIDAYVKMDLGLATDTIDSDDVVDDFFNEIKSMVAARIEGQLSHIDAMIDYLMIIKYLERLGDHAVNICEWVVFCKTGVHKTMQQ